MNSRRMKSGMATALTGLCLAVLSACFEDTTSSPPQASDAAGAGDVAVDSGGPPGSDSGTCIPMTCDDLKAECGSVDDGCGQSLDCGDCVSPKSCSVVNECVCAPNCVDKVCGEKDDCGGTCSLGSGCCASDCDTNGETLCVAGELQTCGDHDSDPCLDWSAPEACASGACEGAGCCEPGCEDKECGDDGCGGTCGDCPGAAPICTDEGQCAAECEPDCEDKECGDDGCGGTCGDCPGAAPICTDEGQCAAECEPECGGKECGDDGCGGTCGDCPGAAPICTDQGQCAPECAPECGGKECGDDGCGGTCGTCPGAAPLCTPSGTCETEGNGCENTCSFEGQTQCYNGGTYQQCIYASGSECLSWTSPMPCFGTGNCVNGACEELEEPTACEAPMSPTAIIAGTGASGSGVCDANAILTNDGDAAEFWSNQDQTSAVDGVNVTACRVVDFGSVCVAGSVCVEAWAGDDGCSGDTCGGSCENCLVTHKVQLEVFTGETNSMNGFSYAFSMQTSAFGDPGKTYCHPVNEAMRYALVCRSGCQNPASAYNAFVDHVWLD